MIRSVIQGITQIQPKFLGQASLRSPLRSLAAYDVQSILPPAPHSQQVRMIRSVIQGITQIQPKFLGQASLRSPLRALAAYDVQSILPPAPHSQQVRTAVILKRKNAPRLRKVDRRGRNFKSRDFIYEFVDHTDNKTPPPIKIILKSELKGIGLEGYILDMEPNKARFYINQDLAVYASPENIKKYADFTLMDKMSSASSVFALKIASELSSRVINVSMNMYNAWTIKPWHIRVAFRKAAIIVPESALTLPSKPIKGPDLQLENKEFLVIVRINNKEEAPVRCRIHHHTLIKGDRLEYKPKHWLYPALPIFAEEAAVLSELTKMNKKTIY